MTAIDTRIFRDRHFIGTPAAITEAVRALCHEIAPAREPVYVACRPEGSAAECFYNVASRVERDGGASVSGWAIWEWPRVMVEAEHHAVWHSGADLVDVTPHVPSCDRVLFLPDPGRTFDFATLRRLPNIKRSLGMIPEAQAFIDTTGEMVALVEAHSEGRQVTMPRDRAETLYHAARQAQGAVLDRLARRTGPNDPCICASGKKYKRCCRPLIALSY